MVKKKSKKDIEDLAEKSHKDAVDAANIKNAKDMVDEDAKLAETPLTQEERDFVTRIALKMNSGRHIEQPSPGDILRYSRLRKREDVK